MPLLAAFDVALPVDGRQSDAALKVRRGAARLLRDSGYAVVTELVLPSGRRADLVGLSPDGAIFIVEVKSSRADFLSDSKWPTYASYCDAFAFAAPPELADIFPAGEGLIVSDGYVGELIRPAQERRLAAATRKGMHLRIALASARRLHELEDPSQHFSTPS